VIGVPKTIDNDLPITDHTPGYASTVKYIATTVRELACDNEAMGQGDLVSIVEVMGRSAGWIAAGASLAKRRDHPHDPPHLILLPEVAFNQEKVLEEVRRVLKREKYCLIVVAEGLVDTDGNYLAANAQTDAFGHAQLGGAGDALAEILGGNLPGVKVRVAKPGIMQRCASHAGSKTDVDEAFRAGQAAVQAAINGETDKMVTLLRGDGEQYTTETGLAPLADVANSVKKLPREWINEDGVSMNFQFLRYAQPLIQGEVVVPHDAGVPVFARLEKVRVDKSLPAYEV
jgi:6-phosphofructokinase